MQMYNLILHYTGGMDIRKSYLHTEVEIVEFFR